MVAKIKVNDLSITFGQAKALNNVSFDVEDKEILGIIAVADTLKEFSKATKIELRKFLDNIKATETKLNGRISVDVVLLRAQ